MSNHFLLILLPVCFPPRCFCGGRSSLRDCCGVPVSLLSLTLLLLLFPSLCCWLPLNLHGFTFSAAIVSCCGPPLTFLSPLTLLASQPIYDTVTRPSWAVDGEAHQSAVRGMAFITFAISSAVESALGNFEQIPARLEVKQEERWFVFVSLRVF